MDQIELDNIPLEIVVNSGDKSTRITIYPQVKASGVLGLDDLLSNLENTLKDNMDKLDSSLKEYVDEKLDGFTGGMQNHPNILVLVEDGASILVTGVGYSEALVSVDGLATFPLESYGEYKIVSTSGTKVSTKYVVVSENINYTVLVDFQSTTLTVKGYGGMVVQCTSPSGHTQMVTLPNDGDFVEETLMVEELGVYTLLGTYGGSAKEITVDVQYYTMGYTVELYIFDKLKLSDCSWATINGYAQDRTAKYRFDVGDTKDITTADGVRTVGIHSFLSENDTTYTYTSGIGCAILWETTHCGYVTHTRSSAYPVSDSYNEAICGYYSGFNSDFQAVLPEVIVHNVTGGTLVQKVFPILAFGVDQGVLFGLKRENNGTGSFVNYWLGDSIHSNGSMQVYYVLTDGKCYYYIFNNIAYYGLLYHDAFRFCL